MRRLMRRGRGLLAGGRSRRSADGYDGRGRRGYAAVGPGGDDGVPWLTPESAVHRRLAAVAEHFSRLADSLFFVLRQVPFVALELAAVVCSSGPLRQGGVASAPAVPACLPCPACLPNFWRRALQRLVAPPWLPSALPSALPSVGRSPLLLLLSAPAAPELCSRRPESRRRRDGHLPAAAAAAAASGRRRGAASFGRAAGRGGNASGGRMCGGASAAPRPPARGRRRRRTLRRLARRVQSLRHSRAAPRRCLPQGIPAAPLGPQGRENGAEFAQPAARPSARGAVPGERRGPPRARGCPRPPGEIDKGPPGEIGKGPPGEIGKGPPGDRQRTSR